MISFYNIYCSLFHLLFSKKNIFSIIQQYNIGFFWKHFLRFFDFFQNRPQIFPPAEILSLTCNSRSILPIAMKVGSKDATDSVASFALLFVKNYAILELSDKIYTGGVVDSKMLLFYRSQIGQCSLLVRYATSY